MDAMSKAARVGQIIIGIVYLIAGAMKVWEPVLFYWESIPYMHILGLPQDNWELTTTAAKATALLGPVELALGLALVCNWRPKITLPAAALLTAYFTALMAKAWQMGASIDCGCFGTLIERSPGEAAVEDGIMLAVLLFAWWGMRRRANAAPAAGRPNWWGAGGSPVWPGTSRMVFGVFLAGLALGSVRFFPELERTEQSDLKSGVRLSGLTLKGVDADLMQGEYLLELFSPKCRYCQDAVPKMNALAQDPQLPRLIALTNHAPDSPDLADFKKRLQPRFDIATISQTDFFRLTFGHGYPRLAYIADGVVQQVWEHSYMPTQARLREIAGS